VTALEGAYEVAGIVDSILAYLPLGAVPRVDVKRPFGGQSATVRIARTSEARIVFRSGRLETEVEGDSEILLRIFDASRVARALLETYFRIEIRRGAEFARQDPQEPAHGDERGGHE